MANPRAKVNQLIELNPKEVNFVIEFTKDFSPRRAAEASGYAPDTGYNLVNDFRIAVAINMVLQSRLDSSHIDAEWVLMEAVDNHMIARQMGNISASNTALKLIAQHTMVDAMASDKINLNVNADREITDRLFRGRQRAYDRNNCVDGEVEDDVSFL